MAAKIRHSPINCKINGDFLHLKIHTFSVINKVSLLRDLDKLAQCSVATVKIFQYFNFFRILKNVPYTNRSKTNHSLGSVWSKMSTFHMGLVFRKVIPRPRLV